MSRTIYYGKVADVMDPANLGRIRYTPLDLSESSLNEAFPDATASDTASVNQKWKMGDPYLVYPLLPIFLYQVPKVGEYVHIIFYDDKKRQNNRFYVQGVFSNFDSIYKDKFDNMMAGLALGERTKEIGRDIITPQTGVPTKEDNLGLYPSPSTIALLGRKNSDILLPEDGFIARVNKESMTSSGVTYNKRHSFSMLQTYPSKTVEIEQNVETVTFDSYQDLNYLIEYNVYGGLGTIGKKYTGYIEIFKMSPYKKVSTSAFTNTKEYVEIDDFTKIGPIYRKEYRSEEFKTITNGFRKIIKNLNDNNKIGLPGEFEFPVRGSAFPFVYRPNKEFYNKNLFGTDVERKNVQSFISDIYLNRLQVSPIFGLVSEKDTMGLLKENKQVVTNNPNPQIGATTVGMTASNYIFLLSHDTQVGDSNKIDFQDAIANTGNTLDANFIWNTIYPNTMSMVRGEKMMELLELIVKYLVSHVHPYHGMTPVPVSMDGTNSAEILKQIYSGYSDILNQNLRIN